MEKSKLENRFFYISSFGKDKGTQSSAPIRDRVFSTLSAGFGLATGAAAMGLLVTTAIGAGLGAPLLMWGICGLIYAGGTANHTYRSLADNIYLHSTTLPFAPFIYGAAAGYLLGCGVSTLLAHGIDKAFPRKKEQEELPAPSASSASISLDKTESRIKSLPSPRAQFVGTGPVDQDSAPIVAINEGPKRNPFI